MTMRLLLAAFAAAPLAACATPAYVSPVEVTRFVGNAPAQLGSGTIAIAAAPGLDTGSLEYGLFRDRLAGELAQIGYRVVDSGAQQVAQLSVGRDVLPAARRNPVSVGGGAGVGSYGSGVGLGLGIDLSGPKPDQVTTTVAVAIRPATGGANLWEGRSTFAASANHAQADPAAAAARALDALFAGFPGNSGETIEVE